MKKSHQQTRAPLSKDSSKGKKDLEVRFSQLSSRSKEIFSALVDAYIETGEAVGSRLLAKRAPCALSSATIRNIMADLEEAGLLYAPHTSAGRIPTEAGLSFFVDSLLECSDFEDDTAIEHTLEERLSEEAASGGEVDEVLEQATALLSGLSQYAGIVLSPKTDSILKRIEFVTLSPTQLLVVILSNTGHVENRLIPYDRNLTPEQLKQLSNYLSTYLEGKTLVEGLAWVQAELKKQQHRFTKEATRLVQQGLETWSRAHKPSSLILKGQANLLDAVEERNELDPIRNLFEAIETKQTMVHLLEATSNAEGIQVFIGSENPNFNVAGCSLVAASYRSADNRIVGALGVIGPSNMHYRQVIPLVSCTAKVINRLLKR